MEEVTNKFLIYRVVAKICVLCHSVHPWQSSWWVMFQGPKINSESDTFKVIYVNGRHSYTPELLNPFSLLRDSVPSWGSCTTTNLWVPWFPFQQSKGVTNSLYVEWVRSILTHWNRRLLPWGICFSVEEGVRT